MSLFNLLSVNIAGVSFETHRYEGAHAFFYASTSVTIDWDIDEDMHTPGCVTVSSLTEVLEVLEKDVIAHPTHLWEVQETRSGYHAVLLTDCEVSACDMPAYMLGLRCDPKCAEFIHRNGGLIFDWRMSPKSDSDPIANPICRVGTGLPLQDKLDELVWFYKVIEKTKELWKSNRSFWFT